MTAHSCYNKPRHDSKASYMTQSGWSDALRDGFGAPSRVAIYAEVVTDFKTGCKYDKAAADKRCDGCVNMGKL